VRGSVYLNAASGCFDSWIHRGGGGSYTMFAERLGGRIFSQLHVKNWGRRGRDSSRFGDAKEDLAGSISPCYQGDKGGSGQRCKRPTFNPFLTARPLRSGIKGSYWELTFSGHHEWEATS